MQRPLWLKNYMLEVGAYQQKIFALLDKIRIFCVSFVVYYYFLPIVTSKSRGMNALKFGLVPF